MLRCAVGETYEELEGWVGTLATKFYRQYAKQAPRQFGAELDDWRALAHLAFMEAMGRYEPSRGMGIVGWVGEVVTSRLMDYQEHLSRRRKQKTVPLHLVGDPTYLPHYFDWREFATGLSGEASMIVQMVFNTPTELTRAMGCRGKFRSAARRFLRSLGWSNEKISRAYQEIREAL